MSSIVLRSTTSTLAGGRVVPPPASDGFSWIWCSRSLTTSVAWWIGLIDSRIASIFRSRWTRYAGARSDSRRNSAPTIHPRAPIVIPIHRHTARTDGIRPMPNLSRRVTNGPSKKLSSSASASGMKSAFPRYSVTVPMMTADKADSPLGGAWRILPLSRRATFMRQAALPAGAGPRTCGLARVTQEKTQRA